MNASVLIVDDHDLLAQSLLFALEAEGLTVSAVRPQSTTLILETAERVRPTVVLLDLDLGGPVGSSVPLIEPLTALGAQVMMVTGVTDRVRLAECIEAGATGLINKSTPFEDLVTAVAEVAELGTLVLPPQRQQLLSELRLQRAADGARLAPFERLTRREQQVLIGLVEGRTAEKIAEDSFVSLATIRSQIRSILLKLDVNTQLAAVAMARQAGWDGPEAE